jgi:hypothetical protein
MSIHDDPPERIGSTTSGALADPKGAASQKTQPVTVAKTGHPHVAIARPKRQLAEAQVSLAASRVELIAATSDARVCELALGNSVADFLKLYPPPSAYEVNRERLRKIGDELEARKAAGLPLNPATVYQGDQSPISLLALSRGHRPSTSLRSTVVRRRI